MAIFLSQPGGRPTRLNLKQTEVESDLQRLIAEGPECPLVGELENARLHVIGREFRTGSGPIDVLAVDSEGVLYIIETKLRKNADRRQVVAQMLDYGAALWTAARGPDFLGRLKDFALRQDSRPLRDRLCSDLNLTSEDADRAVEGIGSHAAAGKLRFVVVMDRLDDALKDLLLFLNENGSFDMLAVELDVYQHEGTRIVIPRVFGAQTRKRASGRASAECWLADEARNELKARPFAPDHRRLLDWMFDFADRLANERAVEVSYGSGAEPSMVIATKRSSVLRISPAKVASELSVSLSMVHWKGDPEQIKAALSSLCTALGHDIAFQPDRKASITSALIGGLANQPVVEDRLRALLNIL